MRNFGRQVERHLGKDAVKSADEPAERRFSQFRKTVGIGPLVDDVSAPAMFLDDKAVFAPHALYFDHQSAIPVHLSEGLVHGRRRKTDQAHNGQYIEPDIGAKAQRKRGVFGQSLAFAHKTFEPLERNTGLTLLEIGCAQTGCRQQLRGVGAEADGKIKQGFRITS